jgi:hypothetical protein
LQHASEEVDKMEEELVEDIIETAAQQRARVSVWAEASFVPVAR